MKSQTIFAPRGYCAPAYGSPAHWASASLRQHKITQHRFLGGDSKPSARAYAASFASVSPATPLEPDFHLEYELNQKFEGGFATNLIVSACVVLKLSFPHRIARPAAQAAVALLSLAVLMASGCAFRRAVVPNQISEAEPFSASGEIEAPNRWWTSFQDPSLDYQVNRALEENYTLAAAFYRLRAARALARREASDLLPDLDGIVDLTGLVSTGDDRASVAWGFGAAYQLDLWGQIESRVSAEYLRANATASDYHAVALTLSAEVARTWFSLIEAHAQLELLKEQIKTNRTGLTLQESRFGLGLIRSADVLRQRQLLESTLEQQVVAKARIELLEHQLAVLLGQTPQSASYLTGSRLPELPPLPFTGLPSDLLLRRPDVQAANFALQAANCDIASAISAQYPRINLTGSLLNTAENPQQLFQQWFFSIGSQLIAPLFDGGQRRAEVDRTAAVSWRLYNEYGQTMLTAFREVEDNLAAEKYQAERIKHLEAQVEYAGQASEQLRAQYLIGDAEYLDVLSAITGQQSLQRQLLSARLELVLIRVSLYLALAGDFDTTPQLGIERLPDAESRKLEASSEASDAKPQDQMPNDVDGPTKAGTRKKLDRTLLNSILEDLDFGEVQSNTQTQ